MKINRIVSLALVLSMLCCAGACADENTGLTLSWESKNISYNNFTDLGNYVVMMNQADFKDFPAANEVIGTYRDMYTPACTATVKKNSKGEVIVGRNMDVEISQTPAYITEITGGTYRTVSFTYAGETGRYRYDQLDQLDADAEYLSEIPYLATDAMNEAGLYIETNMREMDDEFELYCSGTNPGKTRACVISAPTLIALNCATVEEAVAWLRDSYDWYTLAFRVGGDGELKSWNLALIIGDATGNYGLVEFGMNGVYYTPYANGQGNYYIHPSLAEYALTGSGYGRLAAALEGLPACETEQDMLHNMEACMWKKEILEPGVLGYSDYLIDVNERRATSQEDMQKGFEEQLAPYRDAIEAYYQGDEEALRENGSVWTTSFNFGVNCSTKHLILRLWERDDVIVEYQW